MYAIIVSVKDINKELEKMVTMIKDEIMTLDTKKYSNFDEFVEELFWNDMYIIDDGQYIYNTNTGKLYVTAYAYFVTVFDLFNHKDVIDLIEETDEDIKAEILELNGY